ncbi:MAG: MFS transporter [Gammaproteobacteria bacterium]|nr:MFS transporter [Gammaproteobacteria bacterium]MCH9743510.1 MFS transporter [Gammaproteobacteria bacterium]
MKHKKTTLLSSIGAGLEYYDFIIYAMMAVYLGKLFFPQQDRVASLLSVFAIFALGYIVRPVGGMIFGHFGDRYGRKITFVASVLIMAVATMAIGLLPTYSQIGVTATVLLTLMRVLQGLALGAELPGVLTFLNEHTAKTKHRGFYVSCVIAGLSVFAALGAWVGYLIGHLTSPQILTWGWRIPFVIGGVLAIVGYYIRRRLFETPNFIASEKQNEIVPVPLVELFKHHSKQILLGMGIVLLPACYIMFNLYLPTYAHVYFHYALTDVYLVTMIGLLWCACMLPVMGYVLDKVGARYLFLVAALILIIFANGLFKIMFAGTFSSLLVFIIIYQTISAAMAVCYMTLLADYFPTSVRYSGISLCYNVIFSVAGLTPIVLTELINRYHSVAVVGICFVALSIIAVLTAYIAPKQSLLS